MKTLQIITIITSIAMSAGYFPQAYKIWKLKSAREISLTNGIVLSIGTMIWLIYGISIKDWVIIISFIIGVIGSWTVLALTLRYR